MLDPPQLHTNALLIILLYIVFACHNVGGNASTYVVFVAVWTFYFRVLRTLFAKFNNLVFWHLVNIFEMLLKIVFSIGHEQAFGTRKR